MNLSLTYRIPSHYTDNASVWIFQSDRPLKKTEKQNVETQVSHLLEHLEKDKKKSFPGDFILIFDHFLIFISDQIDSMRKRQEMEDKLTELLGTAFSESFPFRFSENMELSFLKNEEILSIPFEKIKEELEKKTINASTLYFDNSVKSLGELRQRWIIPFWKSSVYVRSSST